MLRPGTGLRDGGLGVTSGYRFRHLLIVRGVSGGELGAHLDGLDRALRAGLEDAPHGEQDDAQDEQRAGSQHQDADAAEEVRG